MKFNCYSWNKTNYSIKFDLKMKLSIFLIIVSFFTIQASNGYSQNTKITLDLEDVTVSQVINNIEALTDFKFLLNRNYIDVDRKVSIYAKKERVSSILNKLFDSENITYKIVGKQIVLKVKSTKKETIQLKSISGTVTDTDGVPLPGANILEKGSTNGTQTDFDGKFKLLVSAPAVLEISYLGYISQEIVVDSQTKIEVQLVVDTNQLDEVIVVGYGTQKKAHLTAAVSTVNLDNINSKPITSLDQVIAGLASGVTSVQSNSQPGASSSGILIRGANTLGGANNRPLVIVDGAVGVSLADISPEDVSSITILKDASSTAIYGARAAAGVILVITKRGVSGKLISTYSGYAGWNEATELPDIISNSATYMRLLREYSGSTTTPSDDLINEFENDGGANPILYPNTNWLEETLGGTAFIQSHIVSVRGGTDQSRVAASINYLGDGGLIENTNNKRIGFRINFDSKLSDKLDVGMNVSGNNQYRESPGGNIQDLSPTLKSNVPYTVPRHDGHFGGDSFTGSGGSNPLAEFNSNLQVRDLYTFNGKAFASYKFLPNLKLTSSATINNVNGNAITRKLPVIQWDFTNNEEYLVLGNIGGSLSESNTHRRITTLNTVLNYDVTIAAKHDVSVLAGYSQEEDLYTNSFASGANLAQSDFFVLDGVLDPNSYNIGGNKTFNNLRSWFGRLNYAYDGKYLLEISFRYDGSSKFASDRRWGFFPSASIGWNIHKENFMKDVDFVNALKFRSSYGQVGNNQSLGRYSYISTLEFGADYPFDDNVSAGISLREIANPNLIWETTTSFGVGLDFGLFNNKITGEIDIYKSTTDGILRRVVSPLFAGIPQSPFENLAEVDSKGYEFSLNYRNSDRAFKYSVGLVVTHTENEIVSFNNGQTEEINGAFINKIGHPISSYYMLEHEGIYRTQEQIDDHAPQPQAAQIGDLIYKDQLTVDTNGDGIFDEVDGIINSDDRIIMDPKTPKLTGGLNLNFEYKNFDFNVLAEYNYGSIGLLRTQPLLPFANPGRGITGVEWVNAYHETRNPDLTTNIPRLDQTSGNYAMSDYWMKDFDFIRFKTVQLGYNIPLGNKTGMSRARVYANAQNLFTIHDLPHFDPQNVGQVYPLTRTLTFGLQLTF